MTVLTTIFEGTIMSFGNEGSGNHRLTDPYPTKSQVLGLFCGALGLDREKDADQILKVHASYRLGWRYKGTFDEMCDYHTVRRIIYDDKKYKNAMQHEGLCPETTPKTRHLLFQLDKAAKDNGSIFFNQSTTDLTHRYYLLESSFQILLEAYEDAPYSLEELKEALDHPHYRTYLGRTMSIPSRPILGTIHDKTFEEVLFDNPYEDTLKVGWEGDLTHSDLLQNISKHRRRDCLISNIPRRFALRTEHQATLRP